MARTVAILIKKSIILSPFDKAMLVVEAVDEMRKLRRVLGEDSIKELPSYRSIEDFVDEMRTDPVIDTLVGRVGKMRGIPIEGDRHGAD